MVDEGIVVAGVVGEEVRVRRFRCELASEAAYRGTEPALEQVIMRSPPDLVVWSRDEPRARELGRALCRGGWRAAGEDGPTGRSLLMGIELAGNPEVSVVTLLKAICGAGLAEVVEAAPAESAPEAAPPSRAGTEAPAREVAERLRLLLEARARRAGGA